MQLPLKYASHVRTVESEQSLEVAVEQIEEMDAALLDPMAFRTGSIQLWIAGAELREERYPEQLGDIFDGMFGD